jgi:hypothetical protein
VAACSSHFTSPDRELNIAQLRLAKLSLFASQEQVYCASSSTNSTERVMRNWLEKFNSLSRGMLFSGGYLTPSAVEEIARNVQTGRTPGNNGTASQRQTVAPHLAPMLVCGALQITLR